MSDPQDTAFQQMIQGLPYFPGDPFIKTKAQEGRDRLKQLNATWDKPQRKELLQRYCGAWGEGSFLALPVFAEYVFNLQVGENTYIGPNNEFLDVVPIKIGNNCMIGPSCHFYTPGHPVDPDERRTEIEWATPIVLGDDVWLGGNVTILGGVRIGSGSTIGAGSVITKDVPPRSVVVGNPGRVVRTLPELSGGEKEVLQGERGRGKEAERQRERMRAWREVEE